MHNSRISQLYIAASEGSNIPYQIIQGDHASQPLGTAKDQSPQNKKKARANISFFSLHLYVMLPAQGDFSVESLEPFLSATPSPSLFQMDPTAARVRLIHSVTVADSVCAQKPLVAVRTVSGSGGAVSGSRGTV